MRVIEGYKVIIVLIFKIRNCDYINSCLTFYFLILHISCDGMVLMTDKPRRRRRRKYFYDWMLRWDIEVQNNIKNNIN